MRLKNRKYGRTTETIQGGSSSHIVKIGFDARNEGETFPRPGKYNGFVICRDRVGPDNNLIVDHAIMKRLDPSWSEAKLKDAQRLQLKAPDGLLPKTLHFVLVGDAQRDTDGAWHYPRTFGESLQWWGKIGLCCIGNGDTAFRTDQETRVKKKIECVPVGREGFAVEKFCPHSLPQGPKKTIDCKSHSRLMLCIYIEDEKGRRTPLCSELGWNARFRFDTSSGYNPLRILAELDAAADRCQGKIHMIRGTLSFGMQRKRYEGGVSIVGQVMFSLSQEDIAAREFDLHREKMEREGRILQAEPRKATMMIGMEADMPEPTIDPTEDLAATAAAAEMTDPPWPAESESGEDGEDVGDDDAAAPSHFGDDAQDGFEPPLDVYTATVAQLIDALVRYCRTVAKEEGTTFAAIWKRQVSMETAKGPWSPPDDRWFTSGANEEATAKRVEWLRTICREYEENDIRFELQPTPASAVPA